MQFVSDIFIPSQHHRVDQYQAFPQILEVLVEIQCCHFLCSIRKNTGIQVAQTSGVREWETPVRFRILQLVSTLVGSCNSGLFTTAQSIRVARNIPKFFKLFVIFFVPPEGRGYGSSWFTPGS